VARDVRGVTADEIRVGALIDTAAFFTDDTVGVGARARFARANETGEVPGGRTINMVAVGDIKANFATGVQEMRRLIDRERVFAIVPTASVYVAPEVPNREHVPVFGFGISETAFCTTGDDSYFFGFDGCLVQPNPTTAADNLQGIKAAALKEGFGTGGKLRIALIAPDNPTGKKAVAVFAAAAEGNDMDVVYAKAPSPAPPATVGDYTPYVRAMLATDPDIVASLGVFSDYVGLAKSLRDADFEGMYIIPAADPGLAPLVGPSYAFTNWATPESASTTPAVQRMLDDIEAYKPGTQVGTNVIIGWLAADFFVEALKETGENLTPERLQEVTAHMTYERKGFIGPTEFPENFEGAFPACHTILRTDGTSYTVVEPYHCSDKRFPLKTYEEVEVG
jgi:hypothetical protein